jgi:putative transposase
MKPSQVVQHRGADQCGSFKRSLGDGFCPRLVGNGTRLRILTVIDTFSRFSPAIVPRFNFKAADAIDVLERVCREEGYPAAIRVDQGSEFISCDLDLWAYRKGVTLDFSRPGKPTDNTFIESFNGKLQAECLNAHWFLSLDDAVRKCEAWRRDYNEVRPHSAIGNKTPISLINRIVAQTPPRGRWIKPS